MNDSVSITVENHVADVRLIRADKMNALDPAMFRAIIAAGERAGRNEGRSRGCAVGRGTELLRWP